MGNNLKTNKLLRNIRYLLGRNIQQFLSSRRLAILDYNYPDRKDIFSRVEKLSKEVDFGLSVAEAHQLVMAVRATAQTEGDVAEVGVYEGGSAKLICQEKGGRELFLFDTFEGFPKIGVEDAAFLKKGMCSANAEKVAGYLSDFTGVAIYKGLFPETAQPIGPVT